MLTVLHSAGCYPVRFTTLPEALAGLDRRSFVITDDHVARAWGRHLPEDTPVYTCKPGEGAKTLAVYEQILRWLAQHGAHRSSRVIALGGGVVGDLAGFVAATYMRGVPLVQIPTTLLAQVDSSVGGKVGLDLPEGKNMVGSFYPPERVEVCLDALSTLPDRQFANGMAEVIKYGFILDGELLELVEARKLHVGSDHLQPVVERCIELKAAVVQEDERETTGRRAVLNFGHTVAHAIEKLLGFEGLLHGEAVSIGMVLEARIGELLGITPVGTAERVQGVAWRYGLPTELPEHLKAGDLIAAMRGDKKSVEGRLAFSLLEGVGKCRLYTDVDESSVVRALGRE